MGGVITQKHRIYDVIVIGAGNGGLCAANTAAKNGLKTLLVERHNLVGGFASSFVRGRFEFEISLHELGDLGWKKEELGELGQLFRDQYQLNINFQELKEKHLTMRYFQGKKCTRKFDFPKNWATWAEDMEKIIPGAFKPVQKFKILLEEVQDAITYLVANRGEVPAKVLVKRFPNLIMTGTFTLAQVFADLKMPKDAADMIRNYWLYLGVPTKEINFTWFAIMLYQYLRFGAYIPEYTSYEISLKLLKNFLSLKGHVRLKTEVNKILVKNNQVQGIETDAGTFYSKHIIANLSEVAVFDNLLDAELISPEMRQWKSLRLAKIGAQGFCVYLGLNKSVQELGIKAYSNFLFDEDFDVDDLVTYHSQDLAQNLDSYEVKGLIATVPNVLVPHFSEPGTSVINITTLFYQDSWKNISPEEHQKVKEALAYKHIKYLEEKWNCSLMPYIEEIEIASPLTFSRYSNHPYGAIYGHYRSPEDTLLIRGQQLDELWFQGLRFAGGYAQRAHGYQAAYLSGHIAALKTLADIASLKKIKANLRS